MQMRLVLYMTKGLHLNIIHLWEVTMLHGKVKKQSVAARSSAMAEFRAMENGIL